MARTPNPGEVRAIKALRDAKAITAAEQDAALAALEASQPCSRCGGTGAKEGDGYPPGCNRCQGTGQEYVIR